MSKREEPARYPMLEPYESGMLNVGQGHSIYWECTGNPRGRPAIVLHGGPGAPSGTGVRRLFHPERYRLIAFHQRGCGRSLPHAGGALAALAHNTTHDLIHDMEQLREHLGIERWTLLGVSWGTTLGLAYAQAFPGRVQAMVLALLTLTSDAEVQWMTAGMGAQLPEAWARFLSVIPEDLRAEAPVDAYAQMLCGDDLAMQARAAYEWCRWDHAQMAGRVCPWPASFDHADYRLCFARLVTHYWRHQAFLPTNALLEGCSNLSNIPGVVIQGRQDPSCSVEVARRVVDAWPGSLLQLLDMGHGNDSSFPRAVTSALDTLTAMDLPA